MLDFTREQATDFCGIAHTYKVKYMHKHQGHSSKLGHVMVPPGIDAGCMQQEHPRYLFCSSDGNTVPHAGLEGEKRAPEMD